MSYVNYTDLELLAFLRQNKRGAYNEIYNRYWKKMLLVAWNHSRDDFVAKDIVQDVFIKLWENQHNCQIDNLPAFLATSIKYQIFRHYRKEQRRTELARANYFYEDISLDEQKLDARFLQDLIDGIVEQMPERCRLVFHYSRTLGLKNHEIAKEANITTKTVKNTLNRALRIIRCELNNHGIRFLVLIKLLFFWL
ncbi:RNA polymerase sigma-70 factor [Mucilaginibacter pocheonensis]|uniref:RNA polymerase sigma-70 factor (ECF subfamily) n=1 Tax=Mucilaginibacter pocheonensis TaxID=398050 RepID=A0ABU1TEQ8_9SPHI|nr:RNA polymerase sigma-70 factor [Mucilaginibacter pocheonensis]MDR6943751.1 RNA polymerase sigma-70 factor (ECF subfamily) [Mucilaginibacter pocheonensis]